jgi:hypothetical protein
VLDYSLLNPNEVLDYSLLNPNEVLDYSLLNPNGVSDYSLLNPNGVLDYSLLNPNGVLDYSLLNPNGVLDYSLLNPNEVLDYSLLNPNEVLDYSLFVCFFFICYIVISSSLGRAFQQLESLSLWTLPVVRNSKQLENTTSRKLDPNFSLQLKGGERERERDSLGSLRKN